VSVRSKRVVSLLHLYSDALATLRAREMVDPAKTALFGASYGGSLALVLAAQDTRISTVVVAYPYPLSPPDLTKLVTAPIFFLGGTADRHAMKAKEQLAAGGRAATSTLDTFEPVGLRHGFLARDLSAYDLAQAELGWAKAVGFVKQRLMPPPPKPPVPPGFKPAGIAADPLAKHGAPPAKPAAATAAH
jgi:dienelactone hydrolase